MATILHRAHCCLVGLLLATVGRAAPPANERPSVVPGSSLSRLFQPFQDNFDRLDPARDGWQSEVFHDNALKQLERLTRAIEANRPEEASLQSIVTADFRCTRLRPTELKTVFQDAIFVVRRGNANDELPSVYESAAGLSHAIDELKAGVRSRNLHTHLKVVRVDLSRWTATTTTVFQLGGETEVGRVQQTATWTCEWTLSLGDRKPRLKSIRVIDFEETFSKGTQGPLFQDRTTSVLGACRSFRDQLSHGVDDWVERMDRRLGIDIVATHGLALGDVDGDGLDDLYVCEAGGLPNRLYLHKPDGTARDVSAVTGTDYLESTKSALILDLDNDGDQDLILAADRFIVFLSNDGWGRFRRAAGFRTSAITASLAAADYDLDGDLDVYACGYSTIDSDSMIGLGNPVPFHDANNGARNTLFRNDGKWSFVDVTRESGMDQDNLRFSLAAAWEDYDLDGDPDLYVANDYGRNCLYRNDRGQFTNVAAMAGVEDIAAGMSVSWGDYNRDGRPDLYVSNMFSSAGNRISYQRQFKNGADPATRSDYQRFARGNTLFENVGDGTFRDITLNAHVTMARWAWGSNFIDLNNDGWEDLVVANGMLTQEGGTGDL